MKTIDFRGMKFDEIKKGMKKLGFTLSIAKRLAYEVCNLPEKKRNITKKTLVEMHNNQREESKLKAEQMGQMNTFKFPNYYDETRLSYQIFLNREDHNNTKEFQDMTIAEWVDYFIKTFNYPKPIAKKCGRSMYEFLRENTRYDEIPEDKYPMHPLYESE
tara:strand:+ start:1945 stop:2424 length:480 start_codon:yes stop_codon:yes gene_type:complete